MTEPIRIYGHRAEEIQAGDVFRAVVTEVDGHRVVQLVKEPREMERSD